MDWTNLAQDRDRWRALVKVNFALEQAQRGSKSVALLFL
jgi:hypothetical protein